MTGAFTGLMLSGLIALGTASSALAQTPPAGGQPPAPPPLTNLKIYPKEIARPELIATMQGFVRQLGVQGQGGCSYCHVGTAPQWDFVCEQDHGCEPLPIGDDVIAAIQRADPRPRTHPTP